MKESKVFESAFDVDSIRSKLAIGIFVFIFFPLQSVFFIFKRLFSGSKKF